MKWYSLGEIAEINPRLPNHLLQREFCSFVPMDEVDEQTGTIKHKRKRKVIDVQKGYTPFRNGDVLFAKITPCMENGKCAIANGLLNGFGFGSTEFHVIRSGAQVEPGWIFYYLWQEHLRRSAERRMTGSAGQKRVPGLFLEELSIPLSSRPDQKKILAILIKADRLRRTRRYAWQLSGTYLQSMFLEMFGDPIRNSMGWKKCQLQDLIDPTRPVTYGILKPGPNIPNGVPYIRVVDMADRQIDLINVKRTTEAIANEYKRSKLAAGDLLMSIRGHVGRLAIVPAVLAGANITQDTARLAPVDPTDNWYLMGCLGSIAMQEYMADFVRGAAVQGINLGDVKELPIITPPLPKREQFAVISRKFERLRRQQREAERQAEHLFQTLLHRAFRGELSGEEDLAEEKVEPIQARLPL